MFVADQNLRMRFQRQPRVLGTCCRYVPSNTILQTQGLAYGCEVRIVSHPQNGNDLFVGVVPADQIRGPWASGKTTLDPAWVKANITEDQIKFVIWKDLAQ